MACVMISEPVALGKLISKLLDLPRTPPSNYMDLEGANLSRHGSIYIIQIYLPQEHQTYLIDISTLQYSALSTRSLALSSPHSLKTILEDATIPKVIFDTRNDSDALCAHYDVKLAGVHDLQLMEVATRPSWRRERVSGLAKCIEYDAGLTPNEKFTWKTVKDKGNKLFSPEKGGSYEVFRTRPLSDEIQAYCTQDVTMLPALYSKYRPSLSHKQWREVLTFSENRAAFSRLPGYVSHSPNKALSPWNPLSNEHMTRIALKRNTTDGKADKVAT